MMASAAPDNALAALARAYALQQAGDLDAAERVYTEVLATHPDDPTALINGGALALQRGQIDAAIDRFERVVALAPANTIAHNNLGFALLRAGRNDDALRHLDQAIARQPDYAQAHNNRGIALARSARHPEAIAAFERAVALQPGFVEALRNLGEQSNASGDGTRGGAAFARVLSAHPQDVHAQTGHAFARALTGDLAGATAALEETVLASPGHAAGWQTLGAVRNWNWQHEAAEAAFRHALALDAANADAAFGIASTLLARGDYARGWAAFERRRGRPFDAPALARVPEWNGATLDGTLIVYGEQGFGDVVQFARFIAAARARVTRVEVLLDGYLVPLAPFLATMASVDRVVTRAEDAADAAARVSILSLPHRLGVGENGIQQCLRYLTPPAERSDRWSARMASYRKPRIGIAWSVLARDAHAFVTWHKSVPLSVLAPLLHHADAAFFTIQPGTAGDPAGFGAVGDRVIDVRHELADFADTAALIDNLDLVIAPDTAVAHLAGALGKPVWMVDRFNTCWRWRQNDRTSTWYPSMRIFRQQGFGDWTAVTTALKHAFDEWRPTL